jgi:hypothetical protein
VTRGRMLTWFCASISTAGAAGRFLVCSTAWRGSSARRRPAAWQALSLFQHQFFAEGPAWGHYDTWALRLHGWTSRIVAWKSLWLPPAGCEPIRVFSAFGAAALYRPEAFYRCAYESIDGDIEHSGLHRAMAKAGWEIYLNPAQRSLMLWLTEEQDAKGKHDDH